MVGTSILTVMGINWQTVVGTKRLTVMGIIWLAVVGTKCLRAEQLYVGVTTL